MKKTKIVCTIGPASESDEVLEQLILAGMNVARLNFSHGDHEEHGIRITRIRAIADRLGKPVAILQDIAGPKIRIGTISNGPVILENGKAFIITSDDIDGSAERVSVNYKKLPQLVRPGDVLLLSDGMLEMEVSHTTDTEIHCRVTNGGPLSSHKGVNLPSRSTGIPILTAKDKKDVMFGIEQGVDFMALSFVRNANDIRQVRALIEIHDSSIPLIAKIEKPEAYAHIDEIVEAADGIMVARGDLGVELPFEQVPLIQKTIIRKANKACKPVITATQMLESMVSSPRPTRAEVTDVANAILDGTDAVMLSEESAMGQFPVRAVQAMARIAQDVEKQFPADHWLNRFDNENRYTIEQSVSHAACDIAEHMDVAAIIAGTETGFTARQVSRHRPHAPIFAVTTDKRTYNQLSLAWGVTPLILPDYEQTDVMIRLSFEAGIKNNILKHGDQVVVVGGIPAKMAGCTNFLAVVEVGKTIKY
ncbi:MAG: pyruvate kinase [Spartobacteria bacterium]|nr:pyruvate kinase [Spartobacteria bacterium]